MKDFIFIILAISFITATSFASKEEVEEYEDFDDIVKSLSQSSTRIDLPASSDPFDVVKLHFSVGVVNNYLKLSTHQGPASGFESGMQASLGIDLFSENWLAEGAVRSFSESAIENTLVALHEFDLKFIYRIYPKRTLNPYFGFGVAASYLDIKETYPVATNPGISITKSAKYSTPNSILLAGGPYRFTEAIGMALDFSYRSPMIVDTIQSASMDMTLRLNTTF